MKDLGTLRERIDSIDTQLVKLLNERAKIAQEVGKAKGSGVKFSPSREAEVIRRLKNENSGPLPASVIEAVMREVISGCLGLEEPLAVAFLGPEGAYSQAAARARFGGQAKLLARPTLEQAARAAEEGEAHLAVLPVENSTKGPVGRTLDILLETNLTICDEITLPIRDQPPGAARFLVLGRAATYPTGSDWTSLVFSVPDASRALKAVLDIFARRGIDMTRLEPCSVRNHAREYVFYADIDGHRQDGPVARTIEEVERLVAYVKVLGSYPKAG